MLATYLSMTFGSSAPSTLLWFHSPASTAAAETHMMRPHLPLVWRPLSTDFLALHFNCTEVKYIRKMYLKQINN